MFYNSHKSSTSACKLLIQDSKKKSVEKLKNGCGQKGQWEIRRRKSDRMRKKLLTTERMKNKS